MRYGGIGFVVTYHSFPRWKELLFTLSGCHSSTAPPETFLCRELISYWSDPDSSRASALISTYWHVNWRASCSYETLVELYLSCHVPPTHLSGCRLWQVRLPPAMFFVSICLFSPALYLHKKKWQYVCGFHASECFLGSFRRCKCSLDIFFFSIFVNTVKGCP